MTNDFITEINLITKKEVIACTTMFYEDGEFSNGFYIVKIDEDEYGIVDKKTNSCDITFKKIEKVYKNREIYLLTLLDNSFVFINLNFTSYFNFYHKSKPFKEVIKIFEDYALIRLLNGEKTMIETFGSTRCSFLKWPFGKQDEYVAIKTNQENIPENKIPMKNILLKGSLDYIDLEICSIERKYSDRFLEVCLDSKVNRTIVNIKTFKFYPCSFESIKGYVKGADGKNYAIINVKTGEYILRLDDLWSSSGISDKIKLLGNKYAEVYSGKQRSILRLRDFKEAKFE